MRECKLKRSCCILRERFIVLQLFVKRFKRSRRDLRKKIRADPRIDNVSKNLRKTMNHSHANSEMSPRRELFVTAGHLHFTEGRERLAWTNGGGGGGAQTVHERLAAFMASLIRFYNHEAYRARAFVAVDSEAFTSFQRARYYRRGPRAGNPGRYRYRRSFPTVH